MTVESERTISRFLGLRKSVVTGVLDFRGYDEKKSSMIHSSLQPDGILLHTPWDSRKQDSTNYIFVTPISEDEVDVNTSEGLGMEEGEHVIYSKEEINQANLVSDWGERIKWRETQPADYPPLEPGQEAWPIQLNLKLD